MNSSARSAWLLAVISLVLVGGSALFFFSMPYSQAKTLADGLSKDGNFQSLSADRFASLRQPVQAAALLLLGCGAALIGARRKTLGWTASLLAWNRSEWASLAQDGREMAASFHPGRIEKGDRWILAGLTFFTAAARAVYISRPMAHDEAYTIVAFATRSLWVVLSDYSLPNNHVFHSLLVHFSALLFGIQPWAVRLPALAAGLLLVPAGYMLGRSLYGRWAALLGAGLIACAPQLERISTDARGYTLICLFTLLTFTLGVFLITHSNRAAWCALAVLTALGFYTTPIMLYPAGMLFTWLALEMLTGDISAAYGSRARFLRYLALAGLAVVLITAVLYTPIFLTYGVSAVTSNRFVVPLSLGDFLTVLPSAVLNTWAAWNGTIPFVGIILLAGGMVTLVRKNIPRIPLQAAAVLWLAVELPLQRPYPWPKLWSFLLPLFLIWGAAGLLLPFQRTLGKTWGRFTQAGLGIGICLAAMLGASLIAAWQDFPKFTVPGDIEKTTLYLKDSLADGDIVIVANPDDAPLWYYFLLYQVPEQYVIDIQTRPFKQAYVLVNSTYGQTVTTVINERGPSQKRVDFTTAREVYRFGNTITYQVLAK